MAVDFTTQGREILEFLGGGNNIDSHTNCMTRLRVKVIDHSLVRIDKLQELDYVLRVQEVGGTIQVVIGPGKVKKVEAEFSKLLGGGSPSTIENKNATKVSFRAQLLPTIQLIVMPMIPAVLAGALITAAFNIIAIFGVEITKELHPILYLLKNMGGLPAQYIGILVTISAAKAFKGKPFLPLVFSLFIYLGDLKGVEIGPFTLTKGMGGMVAVVLITFIVIKIEEQVKKIVPDVISTIFVPFLTIIFGFVALFAVVFPVALTFNFLISGMVNFFLNGSHLIFILGNVAIAALWPLMVMTGTHGAAVYTLYPYLEINGFLPLVSAAMLFPASVAGAGLGSLIKYRKDVKECEVASAGAISAFLGITEPLIYGSLIPKGKNFLLTMVSGGIGGLLVGLTGIKVAFPVPGIFLVTTVTDPATMLVPYIAIFFTTLLVATLLVLFFGKKLEDIGTPSN